MAVNVRFAVLVRLLYSPCDNSRFDEDLPLYLHLDLRSICSHPTQFLTPTSDPLARNETVSLAKMRYQHLQDHNQADGDTDDDFLPPEQAKEQLHNVVMEGRRVCSHSDALEQDSGKLQQDVLQNKEPVVMIQRDIEKSPSVAFCRHLEASNVPRWVWDMLGNQLIPICLRAKSTNQPLEFMWRNRNPSKGEDMVAWPDVSHPEMLALWFSAITARSRSLKSVSKIYTGLVL
jgi:hypothetical protein